MLQPSVTFVDVATTTPAEKAASRLVIEEVIIWSDCPAGAEIRFRNDLRNSELRAICEQLLESSYPLFASHRFSQGQFTFWIIEGPSGNTPSEEFLAHLEDQVKKIGELFGIPVPEASHETARRCHHKSDPQATIDRIDRLEQGADANFTKRRR